MKRHSSFLFCFLILVLLFTVSCSKKNKIVFDDSNPLGIATDIEWAVVVEPYVAYFDKPGYENSVVDHGRIGDISMVEGRKYIGNSIWLYFKSGWLEEKSVKVYKTALQAESASRELLK